MALAAPPRRGRLGGLRWPTGAKLFVVLGGSLLPLALIAIFATLQLVRAFDEESRARLGVTAAESSHALVVELAGDISALRSAAATLAADRGNTLSCARARGALAGQGGEPPLFAIVAPGRRLLCGERFPGLRVAARPDSAPVSATIIPDQGLVVTIREPHAPLAAVYFPAAYLGSIARPGGAAVPLSATLTRGTATLPLVTLPNGGPLDRRQTIRTALGIDGLSLVMQVRNAPIGWPLALALLLPVLMWAAAAGIGWFVVDRLLIRPLRRLRASVANYQPGDLIDPGETRALPAQEIRELGDTFRAISQTVALHEAGLAEGLVRQARLTREVHHRVKNNLQVISSLINIHARGANAPGASAAYASIQRRVDALAVVHRHHYAEAEANRGLSLRSILGELASNIRATAPESSTRLAIAMDVDPFLVSQDVAVAAAFLVTETVELAMAVDPNTQLRIAAKPGDAPDRAVLAVSSRALATSDPLTAALAERYGRVMEGLSRQLRAPLSHDGVLGRYAIAIAVLGRD